MIIDESFRRGNKPYLIMIEICLSKIVSLRKKRASAEDIEIQKAKAKSYIDMF